MIYGGIRAIIVNGIFKIYKGGMQKKYINMNEKYIALPHAKKTINKFMISKYRLRVFIMSIMLKINKEKNHIT